MTDDEIAAHLDQARTIVVALATTQVGDHNSMANLEAFEQIDQFDDNPQLIYTVLRVFAGLSSALAEALADDIVGGSDRAAKETMAVEMIRRCVTDLGFTAKRINDED